MLNPDPRGWLHRLVAVFAGLAVVGFGLDPLVQRGDLFSTNWFGGLVFGPIAIVLGLIVIAFALFKAEWLVATPAEREHRHKH